MTKDGGRSAADAASGQSAEPEPSCTVSAQSVTVPNAELPTVTHEAVLKIGDFEITVLQLSNGERVIEEESLRGLLRAIFGKAETPNPRRPA